jgi:hypothetical protein
MCGAFLMQTVVMARKLGLLRKQKFRSRTRTKVAAGAIERVCGECPTQVLNMVNNLASNNVATKFLFVLLLNKKIILPTRYARLCLTC